MKILIIDDSALSRRIMKRSLGEEHTYIEAESSMRGLELYFIEKPDLVFMDLTMPEVSGMEALAQLKQLDPDAHVIVGTADIQEITRQQVMDLGADGFVTKPFNAQVLRQLVDGLFKDSNS